MTAAELLRGLNTDVWTPFRAAYAACDTDAYLALHTRDLIRAGGPRHVVQTYDEVAAETRPWFTGAAERGVALAVEFRFTERLAAGGLACERGHYRITAGDEVFHGRFHTFSRHTGSRWQIVADHDVPEPDGSAFAAAHDPDDLAAFA